jgi:Clp amino terminal domain, pathogenicity island component
MFERYTEQARRVIFFARYETSQFGSEQIEPDHFLLGLYRQDPGLMKRFVPNTTGETIRAQIQREAPRRQRISTSTDMPLSHPVKRILAYGAEEATRMGHLHIGTEHLLLGLLREPTSASRILENLGVTIESAREEIAKSVVTADPNPLTPEEAAAEREALRSMIESLPDDALRRTHSALEHARTAPGRGMLGLTGFNEMRRRMLERKGQMGAGFTGTVVGGWQEGHFSSTSMENGTMVFETRRIHKGHQLVLIEKVRVSDDGKTLHYSQELRGPKGEHSWSMDFDIT